MIPHGLKTKFGTRAREYPGHCLFQEDDSGKLGKSEVPSNRLKKNQLGSKEEKMAQKGNKKRVCIKKKDL